MKKPIELLGGRVLAAKVTPETLTKSVTKMMKVIAITRSPEGRTARIQLGTAHGTIAFEIDEPTAKAIARVFD